MYLLHVVYLPSEDLEQEIPSKQEHMVFAFLDLG